MNIPHRDRGELPPECLGARLALDEASRGPEQAHLRDCPSCSAWAARVGQLEKGIKSLPPVGVRDRALKVLARANSQGVEWAFSIPQGADTDSEHYLDINKRARGRSNAARKLSYAAGLLAALMLLSVGMWLGKHQEQAYQQRLASSTANSSPSNTLKDGDVLGYQKTDSEIDPKAQMLAWHYVSTRVQDDVTSLFSERDREKKLDLSRQNNFYALEGASSGSENNQEKPPVALQTPSAGRVPDNGPFNFDATHNGTTDKKDDFALREMYLKQEGGKSPRGGSPSLPPSDAPGSPPKPGLPAPVAGSDPVVTPHQPPGFSKGKVGPLGGVEEQLKRDGVPGNERGFNIPNKTEKDNAKKEVARFQDPNNQTSGKTQGKPGSLDNGKLLADSPKIHSLEVRPISPGQPVPAPTGFAAKVKLPENSRNVVKNNGQPPLQGLEEGSVQEIKQKAQSFVGSTAAWFVLRIQEELKKNEGQKPRLAGSLPELGKKKLAEVPDPEFLKVEAELKVHAKNLEDLAPKMLATAMAFPEKDRKEALHKLANEWQRQGSAFERLAADSRHEGHKQSLEKLVAITQKAREAALQEAAKLA